MDTTTHDAVQPYEVLSDEELEAVVGGGDASSFNARDFVFNKIGMCGCGLAH